jgi:hypothetical protein
MLPDPHTATTTPLEYVCMHVDFASAVSAWTMTTPGVTWDLDKNLQGIHNVSML